MAAGAKCEEQSIIIALDGSDEADLAVNWYVLKAHRPGNRLVFVHCIELPEMDMKQARSLHMSPGVLASMWKDEEAKTKTMEGNLKSKLKENGLTGVLRTATGKPGEVICRIAEEEEAVLIVVGTRGMGKVRRTILGSVSDYLVNHAHCPVVVCRKPGQKSRRLSSSSDGKRSRNTSGEKSRHASGGEKSRHQSGDKSRHASGGEKSRFANLLGMGGDKKGDKKQPLPPLKGDDDVFS